MRNKIVIIGGGASGLISALSSFSAENEVIICEALERMGKKILATGNGRCNFTNAKISVDNYHGKNPQFVKYALEKFSHSDTIEFFSRLGVLSRTEKNSKVYPYSNQASAVLDALRFEIERKNIEIKTNFKALKISKTKDGFRTESKNEVIFSDKVIVACGGCASPKLGSDGSGYRLLENFGHTVTKLYPALVQIKTNLEPIKGLSGIKINAVVKVKNKEEYGELLFTDYGISGPPVFSLSCIIKENMPVYVDFMPEYSFAEVCGLLEQRKENLSHLTMENYFNGLLNKRLGNLIARGVGIEKLSFSVSELNKEQIKKMASLIKSYTLKAVGTNGFANAQVTAGGVLTDEFNDKTMESKKIKGLYATGEILDIYGDCGGYNLQWAWSSGYLAGRSAGGLI